jgi:hypothetical protein
MSVGFTLWLNSWHVSQLFLRNIFAGWTTALLFVFLSIYLTCLLSVSSLVFWVFFSISLSMCFVFRPLSLKTHFLPHTLVVWVCFKCSPTVQKQKQEQTNRQTSKGINLNRLLIYFPNEWSHPCLARPPKWICSTNLFQKISHTLNDHLTGRKFPFPHFQCHSQH